MQHVRLVRYPSDEEATPILEPRKEVSWEAAAVFNPSVVEDEGVFHMVYRTYPKTLKETALRLKRPGYYFEGQVSCLGYATSTDGINFDRRAHPLIVPSESYDMYGCEDPRVTKLRGTFYITYTAIDAPLWDKTQERHIRIALASTKDFKTIHKHGIIGPPTHSKAAAIFPRLVRSDEVGMLLTVSPDTGNSHIAMRYFDSIDEMLAGSPQGWEAYMKESVVVLATDAWHHRGPEIGAVPIKTDAGWLLVYSAESMSDSWTVTAALLDTDEPHRVRARASGYLLQPVTHYERNGLVPNVTFPEGAVVVGEDLYVYYGAADTTVGLARCNLQELIVYLEERSIR